MTSYDLQRFSLHEMSECSARLRTLGAQAPSFTDTADQLVRFFYDSCLDTETGRPACALVRLFRTEAYERLSPAFQACVREALGREPYTPQLKCLTLVASAGERPEWNQVERSHHYKAIPLAGERFIAQFPMFSHLFKQLGLPLETSLHPDSDLLVDWDETTYNVFYIPEALGSPFVPVQQDFVIPVGIRSVLGFGGILPSRHLFVLVLFTKVPVPHHTAELFKPLALSAKLALLAHERQASAAGGADVDAPAQAPPDRAVQAEVLSQLLTVHERAVATYAERGRRAEAALHTSRARLSAVVQSTKDAVLFLDRRGLIRSWNPPAEALFGYQVQDVFGRPLGTLISGGLSESFEQIVAEADAGPRADISSRTFEATGRIKGGGSFPADVTLAAWHVRNTVFFNAIIRDISDRKRAEAALEESEARFRGLVHYAPDVIFTIGGDGMITSLNPAFEQVTHWSCPEWIGQSFVSILHPDDVPAAVDLFRFMLENSQPASATFRIRSKDRGYLIGEFVGTPQIEQGRLVGILGMARDVTERKLVEEALRESEARLRAVMQSTTDAIISIDGDGNVVFWNQAAHDMFGYSAEEMLGQPVSRIVPERFREQHQLGVKRAAAAGRLTVDANMLELIGMRRDGTEFPIEFSLASWKTRTGVFFTGVLRDITARKRTEEALRALAADTVSGESETFLEALVSHLATALNARWAFLGEVSAAEDEVTTRVVYADGARAANFTYRLQGTPCAAVLDNTVCYYGRNVAALFPEDRLLREMGAESYCGSRIFTRTGQFLGLLVVLHDRPLLNETDVVRIVKIFATRAGLELDRIQTQHALVQKQTELEEFFENAPLGLHWVGPDGRILRANRAELEMLGYEPEDYVGHHIAEFHVDQDVLADILGRLERAETLENHEARLRCKDGAIKHVLINSNVRFEHGRFVHTRCFTRDITRRKQAEIDLTTSEARFRRLFDHAATPMCLIGEGRRFVRVNDAFCALIGAPSDSLVGTACDVWVSLDDLRQYRESLETLFSRASGGFSAEHRYVSAAGETLWVRTAFSPIEDPETGRQLALGILENITERKRAEDALRTSSEFNRRIIANAGEGIVVYDRHLRYVLWNPFMERLTGLSAQHVIGKHASEIFPFLAEQGGLDLLARALGGDVVSTGDLEVRIPATGRSAWLSARFTPHDDGQGRIIGVIGTVSDMTQRKQAEAELKESQERFRLCVDGSNAGIWDWDLRTNRVYLSPKWKSMLGYTDDEVHSSLEAWESRIHPDDREAALSTLSEFVDGARPRYEIEYRVRHKDGSYRWVLSQAVCLRYADGKAYRVAGSHIDVTERKHAEAALRESEERLRLAVTATGVGIWDWQVAPNRVVWSPRVADIFGLSPGEFEGRYEAYVARIHPEDRDRVLHAIDAALHEGADYDLEHRILAPDGGVRWVACKGAVLRDVGGRPARMLGTVQDVTERRLADEERREAMQRLKTLSGRLEVIREEERARIARELHDELGVGLTCLKIDLCRLAAKVEHVSEGTSRQDLLNKLHAMTEFVDATIASVQRLVTELRPTVLDDLGLVAALEWQTQDFQRRTGIPCRLQVDEADISVDAERATAIFRICQEALTNVARHAKAGQVRVRLTQEHGVVCLDVTDDGQGIPPDKLADPRSLGLLGMRERADLVGGEVLVRRSPEGGTTVSLRLPTARERP
ncbi:PAS domain S-box protein [Candidatus Nitrospira bockiana]